jgi:F0F1-type ATP synthase assembly protein I
MMVGNIGRKLYLLTWKQTAVIMTLVTLLAPMQSMLRRASFSGEGRYVMTSIIFLLWEYSQEFWYNPSGTLTDWTGTWILVEPSVIVGRSLLWIPHFIFAILVIRFREKKASKRAVLAVGFLILVLPLINTLPLLLVQLDYMVATGTLFYIGPLPIQLTVGFILARHSKYWEQDRLWGQHDDTWWEENAAQHSSD